MRLPVRGKLGPEPERALLGKALHNVRVDIAVCERAVSRGAEAFGCPINNICPYRRHKAS